MNKVVVTDSSFADLGPCRVLRDEIPDPAELLLRTVTVHTDKIGSLTNPVMNEEPC